MAVLKATKREEIGTRQVRRLRKQGLASVRICRGYPFTPIIFLIFAGWMTIWSIQSQPVSTIAGLGTIAVGYIFYLVQKKRNRYNVK